MGRGGLTGWGRKLVALGGRRGRWGQGLACGGLGCVCGLGGLGCVLGLEVLGCVCGLGGWVCVCGVGAMRALVVVCV